MIKAEHYPLNPLRYLEIIKNSDHELHEFIQDRRKSACKEQAEGGTYHVGDRDRCGIGNRHACYW